MTTKDFAKYVIDNISRASLVNALNITNSFTNNTYDFNEFLQSMQEYIVSLNESNRLSPAYSYRIFNAIVDAKSKCESDVKYNFMMIVDSFIVEIWEIFNGTKTA